jgi:hypothetical protein
MFFGQAAFEERAGVNAGRRVSLKIDAVPRMVLVAGMKEVIEADFEQCSGRGVGRDVATDAGTVPIGPDDHRHRVPADDTFEPAFRFAVARKAGLLIGVDRVHIGRVRGERQRYAPQIGTLLQNGQEPADGVLPAAV